MATDNENGVSWMATHPGTILKYELVERNISQKEFSLMIGMQKSHLSELIKGKRTMTKGVADKIEEALGISSVSLLNMQAQYDYDCRKIEEKDVEEQKAINILKLYDEIFDVKTLFKRVSLTTESAINKVLYLKNTVGLPKPAELKLEANGMFRKSSKTGLDVKMLMTWKILAEIEAKKQTVSGVFDEDRRLEVISSLVKTLHLNEHTIESVCRILSEFGIAFCIVPKVESASVDGYSYVENGIPYIILTKRINRIDNFAFALLHELGHIYLHYQDGDKKDAKLSIPDYDSDSPEEREANDFATKALIPDNIWKNAPKVQVFPAQIQNNYSKWANEMNLNKWVVLGRISYETGMYKFKSDESRKIG